MNPLLRKLVLDPAAQLFAPVYSGMGTILYLDQILPPPTGPRIPSNLALEVTPEFLELIIRHFQSKGYEAIGMDDLAEVLSGKKRPRRKFVCFTFDDGYASNYTTAWPIFKRHGVPFCINVCTHFIEGDGIVWWYELEDLVLRVERVEVEHQGSRKTLACETPAAKESAFDRLVGMVRRMGMAERDPFLEKLFAAHDQDPHRHARETCLNWDQLREMTRDPLVTIGAHTLGHHSLSRLSDEEILREVSESKRLIEERLGREVRHFAYPFGGPEAVGEREVDLVKRLGFLTAVTTRQGNLMPGHRSHPFTLPRITLSGNYQTLSRVERQRCGMISALRNRGKRLITL